MTKVRFTPRGVFYAIALFICLTSYTSFAQAQTQRSFVASNGNDANNCLRPTPCRTFTRALVTTLAGGEVVVVDSAGYGAVTINQSVTISAPLGVQASVTAAAGAAGITVTGGDVVLRGLALLGQGTGTNGIAFSGGTSLFVENCTINGFTNAGISATSGNAQLFVKDTNIRNGGLDGIFVSGLSATIDNCRLERNGTNSNGFGIYAFTNSLVTVSDTVAANNGQGFVAEDSQLNAENCVAANNTLNGFRVAGGGTSIIRVSNSAATNNATGFNQAAGLFESRGNNTVRGNTANTAGTITAITGT